MTEGTPLQIAVVGHTNVGKTSLIRTLTRDVNFGHVDDMPGTTRQVQGSHIRLDQENAITLFDTPGIEDSIGLLDYLDQLSSPTERLDGPEKIKRFLASPEATSRYEQEARVLRKLLDCDAGLYVVDTRMPVLAKHRDELAILASCAKPLLPVLNYVESDAARPQQWRDALARVGLHSTLSFDSLSPPIDGEERLYQALALLLSSHEKTLLALQAQTAKQRAARRAASIKLIASMLVDVAAFRMRTLVDTTSLNKNISMQQDYVRQREETCVSALLNLYQFRPEDYRTNPLPLTEGRWDLDLFSREALKQFGIRVGMGVAAGATAGAAIDVLSAGLSLGTGAAAGAVLGGSWQALDRWGASMLGKIRGYRELTVAQSILELLAQRQMFLLNRLELRGHAALTPLHADQSAITPPFKQVLDQATAFARAHPEWSTLGDQFNDSSDRQRAIESLARDLMKETSSFKSRF